MDEDLIRKLTRDRGRLVAAAAVGNNELVRNGNFQTRQGRADHFLLLQGRDDDRDQVIFPGHP